MNRPLNRRCFLGSAAAAAVAAPAIMTAKRSCAQKAIGEGELKYHFSHQHLQLPSPYRWQGTHGVAVDSNNHLYVIHQGDPKLVEHPSIFVFDSAGKFIRAFGQQFQGGGHGIDIRVEDGTPFLYVTAYQHLKSFAKLTCDGELVWQQYAPMESGLYPPGEASDPTKTWGRNRFMPTNVAFLPDGGFLLADGYGSYAIHRYDADGKWVAHFGGPGEGEGTFNLPHGLWIDATGAKDPRIVVADRANNALQVLTLDGTYQKTMTGFGLPANIDTFEDLILVPELVARVSILDRHHNTLATVGADQQRILDDKKKNGGFRIRKHAKDWQDGKFVHPHDGCFDLDGSIYVAEWVGSGRVTKLTGV